MRELILNMWLAWRRRCALRSIRRSFEVFGCSLAEYSDEAVVTWMIWHVTGRQCDNPDALLMPPGSDFGSKSDA